ncbi:serine/threonine protein kinase [Streptomyces sp. JJ66]|uniref:serine/threonine protein kinase n=1 Tax=Streptomyces sp. JJ66 TaxID=2803843 RepID=UPI001C5A20F7|nr:serine/threonine-protein kinase [Streptomyces sp. JJ66]MBW1604510.1 serine/threonine protein kinase [Streptomyces sp. JJ66]
MTGTRLLPLGPDDPRQLGAYRIERRIASGGMGRIYLGRSARPGEGGHLVAVKTPITKGTVSPSDRRRFAREVELARRVDSVHTARVRGAGLTDVRPWMAVDYIAAPPLSELVDTQGTLSAAAVRWVAVGVARALIALHDEGVIHRDVKPQNVLLPATGPRLIDFGISHAYDLTQTTLTLGTLAFSAPEQARGEPSTTASDVYSLGATLFYLAVGRPPYRDTEHLLQLRALVANNDLTLKGMPRELAPLIRPCLAAEHTARPKLHTMCAELDRLVLPGDGARWLPPRWRALIDAYEAEGQRLRETAPSSQTATERLLTQVLSAAPTRPYTQLREAYTQLRGTGRVPHSPDRLGQVAEILRRRQKELRERVRQKEEERRGQERAREARVQREREEAIRREQLRMAEQQRKEKEAERRREEAERKRREAERKRRAAERRREALRAVASFAGAMLLLAAAIGGMAFAREKGLFPEGHDNASPRSSSFPAHTPPSQYTLSPGRNDHPSPSRSPHTLTGGRGTGGGYGSIGDSYTPPPPEPDPADKAFAAVRRGDCLTVHDDGFGKWSEKTPSTVPCGWLTAYVRVTEVAGSDRCESAGGRTSWSHRNDDLTRTVLCLERQFRTGQCFLANAKDRRPKAANLMTVWDCAASKVPVAYDFVMRITSVGAGTVGNCGEDYAWEIHGGSGTICATVA